MSNGKPPTVTAALAVIATRLDMIDGRLAKMERILEAQNGRLDSLERDKARMEGAIALAKTVGGSGGIMGFLALIWQAVQSAVR